MTDTLFSDISVWELVFLGFGVLLTLVMLIFLVLVLRRAGRED
jgi:hypothetical protein